MTALRSAALATLLAVSACHAFEPQGKLGEVRGRVISLQPPHPLAGVRVVAKQSVADAWTDGDGRFRIKDIPTTWQDLHVEAKGYRTLIRRIRPAPFGTKYVELYLQAESEPLPPPEFLFERNGEVWQSDRWGLQQTKLSPEGTREWRTPVWAPGRQGWAALAFDTAPRSGEVPGIWISDGKNAPMRTASLPAMPLAMAWKGGPFLVNLDGTGMNQGMGRGQMLAMVPRHGKLRFVSSGFGDGQPALSPDSRRIAYTSFSTLPLEFTGTTGRPQGRTQVVVANAGGADVRTLTREGDNFDPAWSPDGRRIAFISNRAGGNDLWVMRSEGSDQQQLTFTGAKRAGNPCWSPDGKEIAFNTTYQQDFPTRRALDLWRVDAQTGTMTMVSNDALAPSW